MNEHQERKNSRMNELEGVECHDLSHMWHEGGENICKFESPFHLFSLKIDLSSQIKLTARNEITIS